MSHPSGLSTHMAKAWLDAESWEIVDRSLRDRDMHKALGIWKSPY